MQENQQRYEEDEIDLRELFKTIWAHKKFIIAFTCIVTILAIIYALVKTPIYEATAVLEAGSYKNGKEMVQLNNTGNLVKQLNVLYIDIFKNAKDRKSWIESISMDKKQHKFIEIRAEALSNKLALTETKKVIDYVIEKHAKIINEVFDAKKIELKNLDRDITLLKDNRLTSTNEDINYTRNIYLPSLEKKITQNDKKIIELQKQLLLTDANMQKTKNKNPSLTALNVMEKRSLENELSRLKDKAIDLQNSKEALITKDLPRLLRARDKILNIELKQLLERKTLLEQEMQPHNYKNTAVVGQIMTNEYPIKPKKKLIVVVAFVTGFILSIFLVFFMEFVKSFKDEEKTKNSN